MQEILPGVWHWAAPNPKIGGALVCSCWLDEAGVLIDPLLPPEGLDWFARRPLPPSAVVLSNRHHYRDSAAVHEHFGCPVYAPAAGMHEFTHGEPVSGYAPGAALPGGLEAFAVGALSGDEGGLQLPGSDAIWLADTVVRSCVDPDGEIGFVPDFLMDDPQATKRGLLEAFARILERYGFQHLLLAHGLPLIGNGRAELERLVREGGRTAQNAF